MPVGEPALAVGVAFNPSFSVEDDRPRSSSEVRTCFSP